VTSFDHADIYGDHGNEQLFGNVLVKNPDLRSKIQIITKCNIVTTANPTAMRADLGYYDSSYDYIMSEVAQSLTNLKTDYLDLLLLHRLDLLMDPIQVNRAFNELKASGKVLNFGVSNFTPLMFDALQANIDVKLMTNQVEINPLNLENFDNEVMTHATKMQIRPMA